VVVRIGDCAIAQAPNRQDVKKLRFSKS